MRRRARIRIAATIAALALLATVPAVAATPEALIPWDDLPRDPSWTAELEQGSVLAPPAFSDDVVVVSTNHGVAVFPRRCQPECEPLWRSELRADRFGYAVAAGEALVVAASDESLSVFPADCRTDGGVCEPTWTAEGQYLEPTIHDGAVVALVSERDRAGLAVFPATCGDPCEPIFRWTRERRSWLLVDIEIANDVAYFVMNPRVYGLSLGCIGGGTCGLEFRARDGEGPSTPVVVDGRIVFTSAPLDSELTAYDEGCALPCEPVWTASTNAFLSPPVAGPGTVYTTSRGKIASWPVDCTDPCEPAWTSRFRRGWVAHVGEEGVVALSFVNRRVAVFPLECSAPCRPLWSRRFGRQPHAAVGADGDVVVTLEGRVLGFPMACDRPCEPTWIGKLPDGEPWWPDARGSTVVVYATTGFPSGGVLAGFAPPDP